MLRTSPRESTWSPSQRRPPQEKLTKMRARELRMPSNKNMTQGRPQQIFPPCTELSGAQTQFSFPWKVFLGALSSEAPEARTNPSRMGEKTDATSLLIQVQLKGDNCRKNVHEASWEALRRLASPFFVSQESLLLSRFSRVQLCATP